ncbi:MAG: nitronate monooxygenase [archaeon]
MNNLTDILDRKIIQGGMGFGVSGYKLARKVSCYGQLGVISATAPDILLVRGLQNGDSTGELRDALEHFPNQDIAGRIFERFFIEGGKAPGKEYILNQFPTFEKTSDTEFILKNKDLEDSVVAGAFVEVYLAKKGHTNPVGANFLNKIEWAQLPTLYGAMLAGIDVVLIGAGFPKEISKILTEFVSGNLGKMSVPINDKKYSIVFDPKRIFNSDLKRPVFLGIVSNHLGVKALPQVDAYVFEGPVAGGHNPPARSKTLNDIGEPLYGPKDDINFKLLTSLLNQNGGHQPYWLAGNYATRLDEALSYGASGVQVGTPFAFCQDSGITPELKRQAIVEILNGAKAYTNARASPTGFPFKELLIRGTMAFQEVYAERKRLCNLGYLVEICEEATGKLITRCPAEPVKAYVQKGGNLEDTLGRKCLCNGLTSTIGFGMPGEKPLMTSGADFTAVKDLVAKHGMEYSSENVIDYILEKLRKD